MLYFSKITLNLKLTKFKKDDNGNLLGLDLNIEDKRFTLINSYGPNVDTPCFYNKVAKVIENFDNQSCILCGDFNLIQNFNLDTQNYVNINNPRSREKLLDIKEGYNLVDPLTELYPVLKTFSWRKRNPFKQSRLDFSLVSDSLFHSVCDVTIDISYRSDHSPVIFSFKIIEFMKDWKFNNSLFMTLSM